MPFTFTVFTFAWTLTFIFSTFVTFQVHPYTSFPFPTTIALSFRVLLVIFIWLVSVEVAFRVTAVCSVCFPLLLVFFQAILSLTIFIFSFARVSLTFIASFFALSHQSLFTTIGGAWIFAPNVIGSISRGFLLFSFSALR